MPWAKHVGHTRRDARAAKKEWSDTDTEDEVEEAHPVCENIEHGFKNVFRKRTMRTRPFDRALRAETADRAARAAACALDEQRTPTLYTYRNRRENAAGPVSSATARRRYCKA